MTTTVLPEVSPPVPPEQVQELDARVDTVPDDVVAYRRRLRRRLLSWSLPVVLVALVVALKLLSMPLLAAVSQVTYDGKQYDRSVSAADALGFANVFEPWVQHFDRGAALAQIGVLVDARSELERALALVPSDDAVASCRVRTDLVLVVEQQGDSAVLDQTFDKAEAFYTQALALIKGAPSGCFTSSNSAKPPASKKPLDDAQSRLQQKQAQTEQQAGGAKDPSQGQPGPGGQEPHDSKGGQGDKGQGSPDQGQGQGGSSQDPQQQLQQKDGQAQKEQQQNNDRNRYFGENPQQYDGKPW